MKWFDKYVKGNAPALPSIDEISNPVPAISEYFEAYRLPAAFRQAEIDTLPVIDVEGRIIGIVTEYDLAKIMPEWSFEDNSYRHNVLVSEIMTRNVWTETMETSVEDLLMKLHEMHTRVIPVLNSDGLYSGRCIKRSELISYLTGRVKPQSIGGLATPLGVYMTDGRHQAGPKNLGLVLTGVAFAFMVFVIELVLGFVYNYVSIPTFLAVFVELALFVGLLRLTPLVRYHAAEHQTINAIEKGLPLIPETVRMQPRPHRRCGTNIMVLLIGIQVVLMLASAFSQMKMVYLQFISLVFGFMFVFSNWRKVGMWVQQYITTARAGDKYIMSGIKAGEEILKLHKEDPNPRAPGLMEKVWNMGLFQILVSFFVTMWLLGMGLSLIGLI